jgi:hypothetical protein|nr:MAG TPA: hypothetical protein [Caudoviricetes sp.]
MNSHSNTTKNDTDMDTTKYTLDKLGAQRFFYDLEDMLDQYKEMEDFSLSQKGKTIKSLREADMLKSAVGMAVCAEFSELAIERLKECVDFNIEILDGLGNDRQTCTEQQDNNNE